MLVEEHLSTLWPHYVNIVLGLWLITSPFAMGYLSDFVPDANLLRVMEERGLPSFEPLGLLAEELDPSSGAQRGNYPQALSLLALVNAALALEKRLGRSVQQVSSS